MSYSSVKQVENPHSPPRKLCRFTVSSGKLRLTACTSPMKRVCRMDRKVRRSKGTARHKPAYHQDLAVSQGVLYGCGGPAPH